MVTAIRRSGCVWSYCKRHRHRHSGCCRIGAGAVAHYLGHDEDGRTRFFEIAQQNPKLIPQIPIWHIRQFQQKTTAITNSIRTHRMVARNRPILPSRSSDGTRDGLQRRNVRSTRTLHTNYRTDTRRIRNSRNWTHRITHTSRNERH